MDLDWQKIGVILGGKQIKIAEAPPILNKDEESVRENFDKLEKNGYIRRPRRTPYGYTIEVLNSRKFWNQRDRSGENTQSRSDLAVDLTEDLAHSAQSGPDEMLKEEREVRPGPNDAGLSQADFIRNSA